MAEGFKTPEYVTSAADCATFIKEGLVAAGWTRVGATDMYASPQQPEVVGQTFYSEVWVNGTYVNHRVGFNHDGSNLVAPYDDGGFNYASYVTVPTTFYYMGWFTKRWWWAGPIGDNISTAKLGNYCWLGGGTLKQDASLGYTYGGAWPLIVHAPKNINTAGYTQCRWSYHDGVNRCPLKMLSPSIDTRVTAGLIVPWLTGDTGGGLDHPVEKHFALIEPQVSTSSYGSGVRGRLADVLVTQGEKITSSAGREYNRGGFMRFNGRTYHNPPDGRSDYHPVVMWYAIDGFGS